MLKVRRLGSNLGIYSALVWLAFPAMVSAATWHVTFDPAHPEDRIGAVAAQAASGDSILIDPGTYYEHIQLEGKSLTFIGIGGASVTTLDGSRVFPGREGSIIYTLAGAPADLALEGLTLRNGSGAPYVESFDAIGGGAILWWKSGSGFSKSLTASDCVFEDNTTGADNANAIGGGAILAWRLETVRLERCSFARNTTVSFGGDLLLASGTNVVSSCSFQITEGGWSGGACIDLQEGGALRIEGCTFESSAGDGSRTGISTDGRRIEILDSRFIDRGAGVATRMELGFGGVGAPRQDVLMSRNLFWNAAGPDTANTLLIGMPNGGFVISENTFVRCGMNIQNEGGGPPILFERNIVTGGEVKFFMAAGGEIRCNDFWGSSVIDYYANLVFADSIARDPLFCNEAAGDLRIARQSPCAAENSPSGCGRIGAFDPACDFTATKGVSWGEIRALFR